MLHARFKKDGSASSAILQSAIRQVFGELQTIVFRAFAGFSQVDQVLEFFRQPLN
jgi:NAD(P)H-dependent FMN reductase